MPITQDRLIAIVEGATYLHDKFRTIKALLTGYETLVSEVNNLIDHSSNAEAIRPIRELLGTLNAIMAVINASSDRVEDLVVAIRVEQKHFEGAKKRNDRAREYQRNKREGRESFYPSNITTRKSLKAKKESSDVVEPEATGEKSSDVVVGEAIEPMGPSQPWSVDWDKIEQEFKAEKGIGPKPYAYKPMTEYRRETQDPATFLTPQGKKPSASIIPPEPGDVVGGSAQATNDVEAGVAKPLVEGTNIPPLEELNKIGTIEPGKDVL